MKDAGIALVLLAQNDDGDFQTVQHGPVLRRKERGNEDNAVHRVVAQCVQRLDLALVFVGRVDEQQLVALVVQHAADALDHASAALAAQARHDDADLPRAAGAHHLRLHTGAVAGFGHGLFNGRALVGAEVAVVEIPADGGFRHARISRKFGDIHKESPLGMCEIDFSIARMEGKVNTVGADSISARGTVRLRKLRGRI